MNRIKTKLPAWFWVITILMLLWNLMGIYSFYSEVMITEEALQALPEAQRNLYANYPLWTKIVFAIATLGGTFGCIALIMRKKWATPILLISFIAIVIQMGYSLFIAGAFEVYGPSYAILPAILVIVGFGLYWFSKYATKRDWIH